MVIRLVLPPGRGEQGRLDDGRGGAGFQRRGAGLPCRAEPFPLAAVPGEVIRFAPGLRLGEDFCKALVLGLEQGG